MRLLPSIPRDLVPDQGLHPFRGRGAVMQPLSRGRGLWVISGLLRLHAWNVRLRGFGLGTNVARPPAFVCLSAALLSSMRKREGSGAVGVTALSWERSGVSTLFVCDHQLQEEVDLKYCSASVL